MFLVYYPDIFCEVSGECLQPTNTNVKKKHNQNSLADFGTIFVEENNNFCGKGNWNGCGQRELPGWIQHAADSISGFQDQCNLHDVCYSNCDKTRTQCENEFRKDMFGVCNGDWSCEFLADLFHTGVTELGEDSCLADRKRVQCSDDGQNKCFQ
uniref:Phospholipase A2 domain-containing protein n=1 Tax=Ditylum brightwellii TaxID=49249 RepID=A0A7S4RIW1_9STRA|mmetsp:Transcript_2684/g.3664  ORF Transcript_2684/g.3664 Transcript_2684/m.3664 type:complete len:154 (-) Transcript_2684:543-1004(-)